MWLNCKAIKKWQPPPHFYINSPFSSLSSFSSKKFRNPLVTKFSEGPTPPSPLTRGRGGGFQLCQVEGFTTSVNQLMFVIKSKSRILFPYVSSTLLYWSNIWSFKEDEVVRPESVVPGWLNWRKVLHQRIVILNVK